MSTPKNTRWSRWKMRVFVSDKLQSYLKSQDPGLLLEESLSTVAIALLHQSQAVQPPDIVGSAVAAEYFWLRQRSGGDSDDSARELALSVYAWLLEVDASKVPEDVLPHLISHNHD